MMRKVTQKKFIKKNMMNLILASEVTGADIFIALVLITTIGGMLIAAGYAIYEVAASKKNLKNAKENQRLMFNQLKKGDYVWEVSGEELKDYVVTYAGYYFDINNICKEVRISLQSLTNEWNTRDISIPVDDSQTYKRNNYYTVYNEASLLQRGIKLKRDKQRNAAKEVTNEKLVEETTKLIERLNKIKKDYL